ncbi:MAG TPA: M23 family metallopeptidase [Rectinemataceae bacterium]|nr:M23 family metallopeptidase [Rectinemataceae bacterium]
MTSRHHRIPIRETWIIVGLVCSAAALGGLWALDWPLAQVKVAATFGTPAQGRMITGVALAAGDGLVKAVDDGELAFVFDGKTTPSGLPSTLGAFAVVEQQNDLAGVYAHMAAGSVSNYLTVVKRDSILGKVGSSGWSEGPGLLFELFDRKRGDWVNPLLVLPPAPDDKAPVIRSVALSSGDKTYVLGETSSIPQATYRISADIVDPSDAPWTAGPPAPYTIRLSIDGTEIVRRVFDVAVAANGELGFFTQDTSSATGLRTPDGRYLLGERLLARGRSTIELSAEDANGNRRSVSWSVTIR